MESPVFHVEAKVRHQFLKGRGFLRIEIYAVGKGLFLANAHLCMLYAACRLHYNIIIIALFNDHL